MINGDIEVREAMSCELWASTNTLVINNARSITNTTKLKSYHFNDEPD